MVLDSLIIDEIFDFFNYQKIIKVKLKFAIFEKMIKA